MVATYAASRNAAIEAGLSPLMIGALDATTRRPCKPEDYYIWDGDLAEYAEGYRQQADEMRAQAYAAIEATYEALFAPVAVDDHQFALDLFDYEAEADDLEDDMLDREFHARGMW